MPDFSFAEPLLNPVELYTDLAETMLSHNGLGLAAPQIGVNARAFVMRSEQIIGVFNPRIVDRSTETIVLEEGCLSYPNLFVKIRRPKKIRARYTLPDGETVTRVFDGMTARVFQHETDHLNGLLFTRLAGSIRLESAKKKAKKLNRIKRRIAQ